MLFSRRGLAVAILIATLAHTSARACAVVVTLPAPPCPPLRLQPVDASAPTLSSILTRAKADWTGRFHQLDCHARLLDEELGHSEARLFALLGNSDPVMRLFAAGALAQYATLSDRTAVRLLHVLSDPDADVARIALDQAVRLVLGGDPAAEERLARLVPAHKELLAAALLRSVHERAHATLRLAQVHPPLAGQLVAQLVSRDAAVRYAASGILASLPALPAPLLPALCMATRGNDPAVAAFAADALARAGDSCAHGAWVRMLKLAHSGPNSCGGLVGPPLQPQDSWVQASTGLRSLGEPGLHALLLAAAAEQRESYGLLRAIARFGMTPTGAEDAALMADIIARFPGDGWDNQSEWDDWGDRLRWPMSVLILEAMLERGLGDGADARYTAQLVTVSSEQWRAFDTGAAGGAGERLLTASLAGHGAKRAIALELLGARYFDLAPPVAVLAATRRALDDADPVVAQGGLVALTSYKISGAHLREIVGASKLIKGKDMSALVLALGSENAQVSGAAAVTLGVLKAPDVGSALRAAKERRVEPASWLANRALGQIAEPGRDDGLPWTRHLRQRR